VFNWLVVLRNEGNLLSKKYTNTKLIRINPRDFEVDKNGIGLALGGLDGLREILTNIPNYFISKNTNKALNIN